MRAMKTAQLTIHVTPDLRLALDQEALAAGLSVSSVAAMWLRRGQAEADTDAAVLRECKHLGISGPYSSPRLNLLKHHSGFGRLGSFGAE